ncbi:MFS general substrate transporter [Rhizodiscina lignyota]|uniref:MFS general substrate transporter n=1 Tax=Rhizodiscina lignyota TaxID=1504668 RepID=A0A9P4I6F3_9PEZI|nr:MFS general substrate transporter [Rhizodiscina lignyota]
MADNRRDTDRVPVGIEKGSNDDETIDIFVPPANAEESSPKEDAIHPPDVGILPWLQVLGGFFLMFNGWGIVVAYGTFQTYYTSGGITDEDSPSTIAWIGSVQVFLLTFGAALTGKWFDGGYFRPMIWTGSFLIVFGMMMTSLATKYYQFMLAQGICTGVGMALCLIPAVGMPSVWFVKRRGFATGIVTGGSSVGGIIYPILVHELIPKVGFPWAVRILAFVALGTLSISLAVLRQRLPPRKRGTFIYYQALGEPAFAFYEAGIFVTFLGFFTFYNFVEEWAIATHVDSKGLPLFYILPIVNAASVLGRTIPNYWSDFTGPLNLQAPAILVSGILVLTWLPTRTIGPLMTIAVLYGFFSGTAIALPPASTASMTKDLNTFGGRMGLVFMALGLASLIGSPVTGAIVQGQNGSYDGAKIWAGVTMLAGSVFLGIARMARTGWKLAGKV